MPIAMHGKELKWTQQQAERMTVKLATPLRYPVVFTFSDGSN